MVSSVPLSLPPRLGSRSPYIARFVRYYKRETVLLHVRYRDGARVTDILAYLCSMLSEPSGNKTGPSRSHHVRGIIGPDRLHTLACGSAYAPTTRTVRMQRAAPAVPSSSAGVTAETTAVEEPQQ